MKQQRCRFCGCTWEDGCPAGCAWAEVDLCSVCAAFLEELGVYIEGCRRVTKASLARMLDEITVPFMGPRLPIKRLARRTAPRAPTAPGIARKARAKSA
jgi:hypothetical protein